VHSRRGIQQFLTLIEVVAFLRQMQKRKKSTRGRQYVEADGIDYEIARSLMKTILGRKLDLIGQKSRELLAQIRSALLHDTGRQFTRKDIEQWSNLPARDVARRITPLVETGIIEVVQQGRPGLPWRYRIGQKQAGCPGRILPDWSAVEAAWTQMRKNK